MKHHVINFSSKWMTIPETNIKLLINPASYNSFIGQDQVELGRSLFFDCLQDWKNLEDEDGKTFPCSDENKEILFRYSDTITAFVLTESRKMRNKFDKILLASGDTQK